MRCARSSHTSIASSSSSAKRSRDTFAGVCGGTPPLLVSVREAGGDDGATPRARATLHAPSDVPGAGGAPPQLSLTAGDHESALSGDGVTLDASAAPGGAPLAAAEAERRVITSVFRQATAANP